jgi:methylated-DNA-[protein]-cysteine S-methyltransferase
MTARSGTITTATGPFTVVVDHDSVVASGWTSDVDDLVGVIHPSLRPFAIEHQRDLGPFTAAASAYHDGDLAAIDDIPVTQKSGPFLEHAWKVLRTVPAGRPITYAAFARECGKPTAVRAAGSACGRNAVALFVPCHRVLRTSGALGGFRWGLGVKRWLLDHESGVNSL